MLNFGIKAFYYLPFKMNDRVTDFGKGPFWTVPKKSLKDEEDRKTKKTMINAWK